MGVPIVLELSSGPHAVRLNLTYRWYAIGDDPWSCAAPMEFGCGSGDWYYAQTQGLTEDLRVSNGSVVFTGATRDSEKGLTLFMRDMRSAVGTGNNPFISGQSGTAHHNVQGTTIPLGNVKWKVLSVG